MARQHVEPGLGFKEAAPTGHAEAARSARRDGERALATARALLGPVLDGYRGPVAVRLWNGEQVAGGSGAARCTVTLRAPAPLRDLVLRRDLLRLAEAHLAGEIDLEGDPEALFDLVAHMEAHPPRLPRPATLWRTLRLPGHHGAGSRGAPGNRAAGRGVRRNSAATITHHYDVGNDFYRLWLDPEMVYSCAYFKDPAQPLAEAQADKLDHICRKLRLAPGQTLLDIGCGWGALLRWAARHYGVRAHGITLSPSQRKEALARTHRAALSDRVTIALADYRDLPPEPAYDAVVSVGMFEHVGRKGLPGYFAAARRVLKAGGLFLNHGITYDTGWNRNVHTRFMNRYVFPDGELVPVGEAVRHMEAAGFEILDVEALRHHYTLTLRAWLRALEARWEEAARRAGEATCRVWRLYMAGCADAFERGGAGVHQVLAGPARGASRAPLRRDDLYRDRLPAGS
jgi:cyclopropane-fatty-acyl-phospholipid synthase